MAHGFAARDLATQFPTSALYVAWTLDQQFWSLGNGTITAEYIQIGKMVHAWGSIILGSTSTVSAGFSTSYPVTPALNAATSPVLGLSRLTDTGAGIHYHGLMVMSNSTRLRFFAKNAAGTYLTETAASNTVPFTWANTDEAHFSIVYEAA